MEKQQFVDNFKLLLIQINSLTSKYCFNELSNNYKFIIEPSQQEISNHLSEFENGFVKKWKTLQGKQLTFDEVVDLFHQHNKTPKWVDCSVYFSTSEITIVHLFFSRQFRDESEIYYLDWGTGPFKALVALPPDHRKVMQGDKFDVNWKWNLDHEKPLEIKSNLKTYHLIILMIFGLCSFFLFIEFGWSAFSTMTERSGLCGYIYQFYNISRTTFSIYNGLISLSGLYFISIFTRHVIKLDAKKLIKSFWHFLIFALIFITCEIILLSRFVGKE